MKATYVFIHKRNPHRIKMIEANSMIDADIKLAERLELDINSGFVSDYEFGYFL